MFKVLSVDENLMKRTLTALIILITTTAYGGVNIVITHPRNPSQKKDLYKVNCEQKCAVEIVASDSKKGELDEKFQVRVKELFSLSLPENSTKSFGRLVYTVTAVDGDKKIDLRLGHVEDYEGKQLEKYLDVISFIETLKKSMRSELAGVKK